jgi:hypothetical protein
MPYGVVIGSREYVLSKFRFVLVFGLYRELSIPTVAAFKIRPPLIFTHPLPLSTMPRNSNIKGSCCTCGAYEHNFNGCGHRNSALKSSYSYTCDRWICFGMCTNFIVQLVCSSYFSWSIFYPQYLGLTPSNVLLVFTLGPLVRLLCSSLSLDSTHLSPSFPASCSPPPSSTSRRHPNSRR